MVLIERAQPSLDEQVMAERLKAVSDWYFLYQYERIGLFRATLTLQSRLRSRQFEPGPAPVVSMLRQFDAREVLYYTRHDRRAAYARLFGSGYAPLSPQPNLAFRDLFYRFNQSVFDNQFSQPISLATVRQAGLELRNNLFQVSYGQIQVLRIELLELLDIALHICDSKPLQLSLGADSTWEVIRQSSGNDSALDAQARQQMATTGRGILRWLAQPGSLQQTGQVLAEDIRRLAIHAQTWLSAAESAHVTRHSRSLPRFQLIAPDSSSSPPPR